MTAKALPSEWEKLPHFGRVKKAIEVGRHSRTDAASSALLRSLQGGGFTERLLAAYAGHGSRDSSALLESAADRSRSISRVAIKVLTSVGDDDSLHTLLLSLPPRRTAKLLLSLRHSRAETVDRFISERAEAKDTTVWLGSFAMLSMPRTCPGRAWRHSVAWCSPCCRSIRSGRSNNSQS